MDSILTQLITLTTPGPLTYIMLAGYTILYIIGVENIRQYFPLKIQRLKKEVDEKTILELEIPLLQKELQEKLNKFTESYERHCGARLVVDDTILDYQVDDILRKQQHLKEVLNTRRSVYLQKRLEQSKKETRL